MNFVSRWCDAVERKTRARPAIPSIPRNPLLIVSVPNMFTLAIGLLLGCSFIGNPHARKEIALRQYVRDIGHLISRSRCRHPDWGFVWPRASIGRRKDVIFGAFRQSSGIMNMGQR
ncbi:hypothetical protein HRR83_001868 [Exophiala dermatitidis]|uniref:Uncharacterized protein n=1 Tax=Exophiala dermatitidis TaxID=5970 RepID=A0AAN6F2I7_EXODE|nr:hypothetical protein HRR73_004999 [Exophiala dermatitidis]KAJ4526671.1 hypothetical protein HRR74_001871 [Exophiala dermatitidis]KAJ4532078.1 hypothetical protein HRR76_007079 [Exophiala dermatitidis]KAJ4546113.1 hypothetical protein HRR77_004652 [Exophiala dermatitidis]KAJ4567640.1 hypothetical protein HRR79_005151 [Exophiala dermatitidis]